jgi:anthranilate phosphoribosyltransferase
VLETLGVVVDAEPAVVERCMELAGIGFAFAPKFHAATRHAAGPRKELGTRTIFNLLGPLTNPAQVRHQVVGVFDLAWCEPMAAALGALGVRRAAVVHGGGKPEMERNGLAPARGIDEIAVRGETQVAIWDETAAAVRNVSLTPASFGLDDADPAGLAGGDAAFNAGVLRKVLAGREIARGERLDAALRAAAMTAALGLELLDPGPIDLARLPDRYARAARTALDGSARLVLHKWREVSRAGLDADLAALGALVPADFVGVE